MLQMVAFSPLASTKPIEVELLVDKNYAPYSYVKNNKVVGIYPEIIHAAFAIMPKFSVKLTAVDWEEGKKQIENGSALALVGPYFHGHDWPYIYPYSIAFGHETVITVCKAEVLVQNRKKWPQDYKGLIVGHIEGYDGWLDDDVRNDQNTQYVNFFEVPTIDIALSMVKYGSLDCTLFETLAYEYATANNSDSAKKIDANNLPKIGTILSTNPVYVGYSRKAIQEKTFPHTLEFQQALDSAFFTLKKSGRIEQVIEQYKSSTD
jgi:polar amino acid transport system substrate-binding protein